MTDILGPLLILDDASRTVMQLAALFVTDAGSAPGDLDAPGGPVTPVLLAQIGTRQVWRARFDAPADGPSVYSWRGTEYALAGVGPGDMRVAFASCNGEEHGDLDRSEAERNVMWARLVQSHDDRPFALLLHGGDQVYADEATKGHPLTEHWPDEVAFNPEKPQLDDLRAHLRQAFFERYETQLRAGDYAYLAARVPSLAQWDDHDICDGWGSLRRSRTYSEVGQTLFSVAREMALLFQHGTVEGDLPARFGDPGDTHLGWAVSVGDLRLVAPDLRSERTRRQIMGAAGWDWFQRATGPFEGRTVILSSVPLLGPRLSVLEAMMVAIPRMQKYEDDLRDQWQSRAHRDEWRRMLSYLDSRFGTDGLTVLSGEIHLATRAEMRFAKGGVLQQLVASGVTHRPPPVGWARFLGTLASLPDTPLKGRPIRIPRLPGTRARYVAERNLLCLERHDGQWSAEWWLEHRGITPPLPLSPAAS